MITKEMTVGEIIEKYPGAAEVMLSHGLHCIGCHVNAFESLEDGALGHGLDEEEINSLVRELNSMTDKPNKKDTVLTLTVFAASKILELMKSQNKPGLRITAGRTYAMNFDQPRDDDIVIEERGVQLFVDPKSMEFLNGTRIDYVENDKESGFRFDNPSH